MQVLPRSFESFECETARGEVIVSSMASDSHTWNLVFLQLVLEESGHRVRNLGACTPDELLVAECAARRPDLVVLSTVNGHGFQDGLRVIRLLRALPDAARMPIVIGGKLGIDGSSLERSAQLVAAGFDAVFEDGDSIEGFRDYLAALPVSVAR